MKRFDLTFKGDILPDFEPDSVRAGFAELFSINDTLVIDELFSGDSFVLRSNLDRKAAADYFRKVSQVGGRAELVPSEEPKQHARELEVSSAVFAHNPASKAASRHSIEYEVPGSSPGEDDLDIVANPETNQEYHQEAEAVTQAHTPSASEILQRLQSLKRDAEVAHQAKVEQLQQLQSEVKQETSAALEQIKQRRDQILMDSQDELARLQQLEAKSREQYNGDVSALTEEEEKQSHSLQVELKALERRHHEQQTANSVSRQQLEDDRESYRTATEAEVAALEARITALREQCAERIAEADQLLLENQANMDNMATSFNDQTQSLQNAYQNAIEKIELEREAHASRFESELEEISQQQMKHERYREEQLTELWTDEEENQRRAQQRLKQLEVTRKRQQQELQQHLQRLQEEEDKVSKGEVSLP
ncbi:hypothetical protein [Pseudohalioglobus lutimaris]|uniref:Uncharacterized protein n=1 Tax=Pseudohalioglobus lutimaris TaxID=1737061 RepID=A0A2N5X0M7_9GAMM|nr:hypothetical protein [Pseudohalioglobus lutimaris]PLW68049.1 hypothetical protein C0039_13875 [Pseudohalioglobus lutimaris]